MTQAEVVERPASRSIATQHWPGMSPAFALVIAAAVAFGVVAAGAALVRWQMYQTSAFDLAFFDQVIWNTAHGRWWQTTFVPYSFAGEHLEPVLLVYALSYRLGAAAIGPQLLLISQAVLTAGAAVPLYLGARRIGVRTAGAVALVGAYLLNPYLHRALGFDFHTEVMAGLPAFAAIWALAFGREWLYVCAACSTLTLKEDAAFVVLALAVFGWILGARRASVAVALCAAVYLVVGVGWILPMMRNGVPSDLVPRYSEVMQGPAALIGAAFEPWRVARASLFVAASAPVLLVVPWSVLLLLPGLGLALLSSHPPQQALELHYAAELVPIACLGAIFAVRALQRRCADRTVAMLVLAPVVAGFVALSPVSPLHTSTMDAPSAAHREAVQEALTLIPRTAAVSAQSGLLPRLAQREAAWEFPSHWQQAQWIVVDARGHRSSQSEDAGYTRELEAARRRYTPVYSNDGVEVLRAPGAIP